MGVKTEKEPHYTCADYEHWEDQWELIEGNRVEQPEPLMKHQRIATRLTNFFFNALKDSTTCTVYQPVNYRVADDTVLIPDMLVVPGDSSGLYLDIAPLLIAEILSPSTASRDKKIKYNIYESQGVLYYLILSPEKHEVEIYQWENGKYVLKARGTEINFIFSLAGSKAKIDFGQVW